MTLTRWSGRSERSPTAPGDLAPRVSDADFTYITSDEVRRGDYDGPSDGKRDTDVLTLLLDRTKRYPVHFPAHSIDREELSVGALRQQAVKRLAQTGASTRHLKLYHRGKVLAQDAKSCRAEGIKQGAEIQCSLNGEIPAPPSEDAHAPSEEETSRSPTRRKGGKKAGRTRKSEGQGQDHLAPSNVSRTATPPSRPSSTAPPPSRPTTPNGMLDAIRQSMDALLAQCEKFKANPPTVLAKREFEHKRLAETILTQVLLKLDAVETEDVDLRTRRKELVREAQAELKRLDEFMR